MTYGLYAYGLAAGASAMAAVLFFLLGIRRPANRPIQLSIAFLAGIGSASALVHVQLQSTRDIDRYAALIKGPFAVVGLFTLMALVWVIGAHTTVAYPRVPIALSMATLGVAVVNLATPDGLLVNEVSGLREVSLLGDSFVLHEPSRSPWRVVLDVYLIAIAAYAAVAIAVRLSRRPQRRGRSARSIYTSAGLGLMLAFTLYDSLVDEAVVGTPYLAPFGVVGLVLGLALAHTDAVAATERQLLAQSTELEAVIKERTRALATAHDQLIDQLDRQRQAAEHLAHITHEFVVLNSVALAPGRDRGFQRAVEGVLGCVGEVVSAREVRLELEESAAPSSPPLTVGWRAPDRNGPTASGPRVTRRVLKIGDLRLGSLTITWTNDPDLSDQQLQLIGLATDYLAAVLHRLDIQWSLVASAVDSERQRIARELHDSVSQRLYAAAFNAEHLATSVGDDPAGAAELSREIRTLVLVAVAETRTLLFELQPKMLETASLSGLLVSLCESMGASHHRPIEVVAPDGPAIPHEPKLAIYRIAQEALGNALRHAEASSIHVALDVDDEGVLLEVADDGLGFEPDDVGTGYGLHNMTERAAQIGSELEVTSRAGHGTTVLVRWRFRAAPHLLNSPG